MGWFVGCFFSPSIDDVGGIIHSHEHVCMYVLPFPSTQESRRVKTCLL